MKVSVGDRFQLQILIDGVDYGLGDAWVTQISPFGVATLIGHGRPDAASGKLPILETVFSIKMLERVKDVAGPQVPIGIFPELWVPPSKATAAP